MNEQRGQGSVGRVVAVLLGVLVTGSLIRLVGPQVGEWSDRATWELLVGMLVVAVSFTAAVVVERMVGVGAQPVSAVLASIGFRTGGVAAAVVVAAVAYPERKVPFLIVLASLYVVALLVDTVAWSRSRKTNVVRTTSNDWVNRTSN